MWLIHVCDTTHSYVRHDPFKCICSACSGHTRLMLMCDVTHWWVGHDSSICGTWLIYMCSMTNSYVWHGSIIFVTWLIHMCDLTEWHEWHDSFMCVTWLIHVCDMTHLCVRHDFFICILSWLFWSQQNDEGIHANKSHSTHRNESCHTLELVMSHTKMSHVTLICKVWPDSFTCATWRIHMCDVTYSCLLHA